MFQTAIKKNKPEKAKELYHKEKDRSFALYITIRYGRFEILKYIFSVESHLTFENLKEKALSFAVTYNKQKIVKYIISLGVSAQKITGLLLSSIYYRYFNMTKFLVSNGAVVTSEEIKMALKIKDKRIVNYLLIEGEKKGLNYDLSKEEKGLVIQNKYYSKWRTIVLKNFIRKVVTPLYYSSGFNGAEKEKKELRDIIN